MITYPQSSDFYFINKLTADPSAHCVSCIKMLISSPKKTPNKHKCKLIRWINAGCKVTAAKSRGPDGLSLTCTPRSRRPSPCRGSGAIDARQGHAASIAGLGRLAAKVQVRVSGVISIRDHNGPLMLQRRVQSPLNIAKENRPQRIV